MTKKPDFNGSGASYNIWIKKQNSVPYVVVNGWILAPGHWFLIAGNWSWSLAGTPELAVIRTSDQRPGTGIKIG